MTSPNDNAHGEVGADVDQGWRAEATLKNTGLDYRPLAVLIQANIDGQRAASICLETLQRYHADPDALYLALKPLLPDTRDSEKLAAIRGFCRVMQKHAERGQA